MLMETLRNLLHPGQWSLATGGFEQLCICGVCVCLVLYVLCCVVSVCVCGVMCVCGVVCVCVACICVWCVCVSGVSRHRKMRPLPATAFQKMCVFLVWRVCVCVCGVVSMWLVCVCGVMCVCGVWYGVCVCVACVCVWCAFVMCMWSVYMFVLWCVGCWFSDLFLCRNKQISPIPFT